MSHPSGIALITGASSGIGAATAVQLAHAGMRVVLVARSAQRLRQVALRCGGLAVVEECDVGIGHAVLSMADRVRSAVGVPDVIINSAGAGAWKRIEETSPDEAHTMMAAPYMSAFHVTHAFMRDWLDRESGIVVHVGSPASFAPWPSSVGYSASRAALRGLHEALVQDLHGTGIRTCHVVFGRVESAYFETNKHALDRMPGISRIIPTITPERCAQVIERTIRRPRSTVLYPFPLRAIFWIHHVFPGITRWLLRRTGHAPGRA